MHQNTRAFCMVLACIITILIFGLRYRVGIDTINYIDGYRSISKMAGPIKFDWQNNSSPAYGLICTFFKHYTNSFWPVQLVMASITNTGIYYFLYKHCENPFIGIFIYFILAMFYFNAEIMKESAAIGIFLLNFNNLYRRRLVRYYIIAFLSIAFHYSAFLILIFPFVRHIQFNIAYIIATALLISIAPLLSELNKMLAFSAISAKIDCYNIIASQTNLNFRLYILITNLIPALASLIIGYKFIRNELITKFVLLHILLCAGVFATPIIFGRFTNYTLPFVIVSIANVLILRKIKLYLRQGVLICAILSQTLYYKDMWCRWVPYVSVFNPHKVPARERKWMDYNAIP